MPIDLQGKPIAITGASSGIGAATAIACARAGMPVALAARRKDKLDDLVERIEKHGGRAVAAALDVRDADACAAFIELCVSRFGSIHAVYANAGYGEEAPMDSMSDARLREMFEVNFFGSMNVVRPALRHMLAAPTPASGVRGHVLFCSSCVARLALPYYGAYSATKAAQHHVGRAMRLELEPKRIAVTTVHPIGTRTEFFQQVEVRSGSSKLLSHTPDTFLQRPDYVAALTVRCLRRPRSELWPGPAGAFVRFGMSVLTLLPGWADFFLRGHVDRRIHNHDKRAEEAAGTGG